MKCLVTGGAGFIGSNLVDMLIQEGNDVTCLDINADGYWNSEADNHVGDVCNEDIVNRLTQGIDWVFHLAADVMIQETIQNPIHCYHNNVVGTATVLQSVRENKVKRFVMSSTSAIYKPSNVAQMEGSPEDPCLNPYASSKKCGEDMCRVYSNLYGTHTTILRYFNVYGDRQHSYGQYAPVLGIFMKQRNEDTPLTITGDGKQRRDFINVKDVARANIAAAQSNTESGRIYNVGSGVNYSVQEIADMIHPNQTYIDKRLGEVQYTKADISTTECKLNWKPTIQLDYWLQNELETTVL